MEFGSGIDLDLLQLRDMEQASTNNVARNVDEGKN